MASVAPSSPEDTLVEQPALEWLELTGWTIAHGPDLAPDGSAPERADYRDVVLVDRLRAAVRGLNPDLPGEAVERVIELVRTTTSPNVIDDHADFHRLLVDGVPISYVDEAAVERATRARLVDFADPAKNAYLAVNQFTVIVGDKNRRPDVLLFVNGLPLGQLELKSPTSGEVTLDIAGDGEGLSAEDGQPGQAARERGWRRRYLGSRSGLRPGRRPPGPPLRRDDPAALSLRRDYRRLRSVPGSPRHDHHPARALQPVEVDRPGRGRGALRARGDDPRRLCA